jgi:hypothetical protein
LRLQSRKDNTKNDSVKKKVKCEERRALVATLVLKVGGSGKGVEEFQAKKLEIAGCLLAEHPGRNGRSFVGDQARGRGRGGGNGELYKLFVLKDMGRGDASASGADIEGLGQLYKVHPKRIRSAEEDGNLDTNPRILALMGGGHGALGF